MNYELLINLNKADLVTKHTIKLYLTYVRSCGTIEDFAVKNRFHLEQASRIVKTGNELFNKLILEKVRG